MSIVDAQFKYNPSKEWEVYIRQPSELPLPPPYKTTPKTKVAKSATSSVGHNRRNIESPCHALYGTIFNDLTEHYDNIFPHVQYTLDLLERPDGTFLGRPGRGHSHGADFDAMFLEDRQPPIVIEEEVQGEDWAMSDEDEELVADAQQAAEEERKNEGGSGRNNDDNPAEGKVELVANTSTGSAVTVISPKIDLIPDIAVLHARLSPMPPPGAQSTERIRFSRRAGVQINHLCPAIIGEFKRMPSRRLLPTDSNWDYVLLDSDNYFQQAYTDLFVYVAYVFAGHPYLKRVVAFAGVGIYWTYAVFTPDDVSKVSTKTGEMVEDFARSVKMQRRFARCFYAYQEVGTTESDQAFTLIRNKYLHPLACDNFDDATDRAHAERARLQAEQLEKEQREAGGEFIHI